MSENTQQAPERVGLMLCCMRTAERYGDSNRYITIPEGTVITCGRCGQKIESMGDRAWKASEKK